MTIKYIPLEDFSEILEIINQRDHYHDWSERYDELDNRIKAMVESIKKSAKSKEEL